MRLPKEKGVLNYLLPAVYIGLSLQYLPQYLYVSCRLEKSKRVLCKRIIGRITNGIYKRTKRCSSSSSTL